LQHKNSIGFSAKNQLQNTREHLWQKLVSLNLPGINMAVIILQLEQLVVMF